MNFNAEFNKIIICREFGYTEDEYDSNSLEFNIMAGILLSEESKVSKNRQKTNSIPKPRIRRRK